MNKEVLRVIKAVIHGVLKGIIWYLIFFYLIPLLFLKLVPEPQLPHYSPALGAVMIGFFIGLHILEGLLRTHPLGMVLSFLSKIIGMEIVLLVLNFGRIEGGYSVGAARVSIYIDIQPLLYLVFAVLMIYGVADLAFFHQKTPVHEKQ